MKLRSLTLRLPAVAVVVFLLEAGSSPAADPVHPEPVRTGGFISTFPPNLVTPRSNKRHHLFYTGEALTFTLGGASQICEVRDYWGTLVAQGAAGASITIPPQPPGWYKLYVYGSGVTAQWGDIVGGTTFVVFRNRAGFPARPSASTSGGPEPLGDEVMSGLVGVGVERIPCKSASSPDWNYLDTYVAASKQWYVAYAETHRPRPLMIAFPNGTADSAGVRSVVNRYKNDVKYWEPRNEPNDGASGSSFVTGELIPFCNAVKGADPTAKVMGPGVVSLDNSCRGWLRDFFAAGGGNYIDAFSFHAYNTILGDISIGRERLNWLSALLAQHGKSQIEKWQTEQGYSAPTW